MPLFLALIVSLLLGLTAFQPSEVFGAAQEIKKVSPNTANSIIKANRGEKGFAILDVRTPKEFAAGHIKGAENMDYYSLSFQMELEKLSKRATYVIHCRSGKRSGMTLRIMEAMGFDRVYDIEGGIMAWKAAGLPVEK